MDCIDNRCSPIHRYLINILVICTYIFFNTRVSPFGSDCNMFLSSVSVSVLEAVKRMVERSQSIVLGIREAH